jgi:hypothetical protein
VLFDFSARDDFIRTAPMQQAEKPMTDCLRRKQRWGPPAAGIGVGTLLSKLGWMLAFLQGCEGNMNRRDWMRPSGAGLVMAPSAAQTRDAASQAVGSHHHAARTVERLDWDIKVMDGSKPLDRNPLDNCFAAS